MSEGQRAAATKLKALIVFVSTADDSSAQQSIPPFNTLGKERRKQDIPGRVLAL